MLCHHIYRKKETRVFLPLMPLLCFAWNLEKESNNPLPAKGQRISLIVPHLESYLLRARTMN